MNGAAMIPAVVEKHLDAIQFWQDGKLVLASSNLTGRYWNGALFCFGTSEEAPDVEKCICGHETESGISDICCLKQDKVIIGMDSGALQLYEFNVDVPVFISIGYGCEHDNHVSSVSVNCNESLVISAGYDKCVKVWDLQLFSSIATYRPVHAGIVWQVSCSPVDPQIILSCGDDNKLLLMDLRLPKPAITLSTSKLKSCPTAVAWKPASGSEFAVGDDSGHVIIQDIRNSMPIIQYDAHDRRIHRLVFSSKNPTWLASCADSSDVFIKDIDNLKNEYRSDIHDDFVRGLAWDPDNSVVTCGWDKNVLKHDISFPHLQSICPEE